jgi:hypothetical protein
MPHFEAPTSLPPIAAIAIPTREIEDEVLRNEDLRLSLREELLSLPTEQAMAYWRTSLAAGKVHASLILRTLDLEMLRLVWRETPSEAWTMNSQEARYIVLTLGEEALAVMQQLAARGAIGGGALLDVRAPWVALAMAKSLVGQGSLEAPIDAYRWLVQHEDIAIDALIHSALTAAEADRPAAQRALRWLSKRHEQARVLAAAQLYGDDVVEAIRDLLDLDRDAPPPFARPLLKAFAKLTPLRLKTGEALDAASMEVIGRMLAAPLTRSHSAMRDVIERCEESSLQALGQSLFALWVEGGMATQNQWIASAHLTLGGDDAARSLGRAARTWMRSKETHDKRAARLAVAVLGDLASDAAIAEIATIASTSRDAETTLRATHTLARIALERDTEVDMLGAPTAIPTPVLDYGARRFTTKITSVLTLSVWEDARALEELPRPTKKDDAAKAKQAKEAFTEARDVVRDAVRAESLRLEHAMVTEAAWPLARFQSRLAPNAIAGLVAQRVLFGARLEGETPALFRVDETGALVSVDDAPLVLSASARIVVAHRLMLDASALHAWQRIFADYALITPFAQLDRATHEAWPARTPELHAGAVLGLRAKGWRLLRERSGEIDTLVRAWPSGTLRIEIEPGVRPDRPIDSGPQNIRALRGHDTLTPIAQSESLRELFGDAIDS